jgi:putative ABC transport system ATP-binding protein
MLIALDRVSKSYFRGEIEIPVLHELSITIPSGQFVFVVGPSGSGKSTLLYLLGAMDQPTQGTILVDGVNLTQMKLHEQEVFRREQVGFIFQNFNLISTLNVVDNVLIPYYPRGITTALRQAATTLLKTIGLEHRLHHRPDQLSGGEQQRVAIARALLKKPRLILADEPTGELDTKTGMEIFRQLRQMHQEFKPTVLIVTHDRRYIEPGDMVLEMIDGALQLQTTSTTVTE